jgi:hypothetical protein
MSGNAMTDALQALDSKLTAHEAEVRKFTKEKPMSTTEFMKATSSFNAAVDAIRERDKVDRHTAMTTLAIEQPDAVEAYRAAGNDPHEAEGDVPGLPGIKKSLAVGAFESKVESIMKRDGISRYDAYAKAGVECPEGVAAVNAA